jgi:hypothetical protein
MVTMAGRDDDFPAAKGYPTCGVAGIPPPKRLLKGLPRRRLQLDDATISRGVLGALEAGWEPMSRGKPMVSTVDSKGN